VLQAQPPRSPTGGPDLADVKGQTAARRALEIAAAGGHGLLMVGPPGSGKSMLAQRFAGLLPAMQVDEALESAAVASLAGSFRPEDWGRRPTRQPHHTASAVALVGGGSPPRPGEISLAHQGVLFWTSYRNSPVPRWRPCASRSKPATSPSPARRSGRNFRPGFS
jgi:magnesium chelatase family protein